MTLEQFQPNPPTIVVADDDADVRTALVTMLEDDDRRIEWEECGAGLLCRLRRRPDPALVVTDLRMPWLDGLEVLERAARAGVHVPAILYTAFPDDGVVRQRAQALDVQVLPKPLHPWRLREHVDELLTENDFWAQPEHDGYSAIRPRARRVPI